MATEHHGRSVLRGDARADVRDGRGIGIPCREHKMLERLYPDHVFLCSLRTSRTHSFS